jgi:aryl-alcohol dehydrogenase-like predicted oxidoreductase
MRYRTFPGADVTVSEVGFGTWTVSTGWWGEKSDDDAVAMLRRALDDDGVTFFDAADTYGNGRAERQIATAFKGRRSEVVIGSKVGYDIYDEVAQQARRGQSELPMRTDPAYIGFAVDKCLERLETDYLDVLQVHNVKMEQVRQPELWDTLRQLKREGKIRAWQHPWTAMLEAARASAPQCCFNIRVTHASGMLEGKYTEDTVFPPNDHRRHRPRSWLVNGLKKISTLDFLTKRMTLGQAALKWLLAEPLVVTTLPNIYEDEQLAEFAIASDAPDLTSDEIARVAELAAGNFGVVEEPMAYKGTMQREEGLGARA